MATQKFDSSDGRLRGRRLQQRRLRLWSINPHCAMCGKLTNYPDFQLDHKEPLYKGGEDTDENCQILCVAPCHQKKTAEDMGIRYTVEIDVSGWPKE